ncbi:MAG TPA: DUF5916 domain-containing protein [Longimicrobiales bacterium]|nr:DUF5916 domain-containing protein [Longimicrobiales bacterium]
MSDVGEAVTLLRCSAHVLLTVAVGLWWPVPTAAQDAAPDVLRAYRVPNGTTAGIRVDGLLGEEVWSHAAVTGGFRQREPAEGDPATERTEVRVVYDAEALYVAVMAYDREPDRVVARLLQRDKLLVPDFMGGGMTFAGDDAVALVLDPFHDHRSGIIFATNANGAEFEASLANEGSDINVDWRGVWEVASARTSEGWSAEFSIPWRTLRYPDAVDDAPWGLNVLRFISRKNEETLWRSWRREGEGFHRVSRAGHLVGLSDLPRGGLNLEVKPFLLGGTRQELDDAGSLRGTGTLETGLDLKTELRPGLVLDLTFNTDFAQVEVDDEKVNLTRFDLFFPEKRDFFLENSGIFHFGVPNNPFEPPAFQMFFSRRIGIEEDEGAVPILGGARLNGRIGGQTVGVMSLATDEAYGLPGENFSVLRVKRDLGTSNYLGAMITDRRGGGGWNTVAGVDGQYVSGPVVVDAFYARTFTGGVGGDDAAYRFALDYTGDRWGGMLNHVSVGPDVEASSGFITREDTRKTDAYGRRRWRTEALGLRRLDLWVGGSYSSTMSGRQQDYSYSFALMPEWNAGENFTVFSNVSQTILDETFELTDSVEIPVGRYQNDNVMFSGGTSQKRAAYLNVNGMLSRFYGGSLVSLGGTLTLAPVPQVAVGLGYTRNDVDVPFPHGEFTADILSLRTTYSFSTRLTTNVLVQYNSLDRDFTANVRVNFIHRPGSDLFLVFTENRGDDRRLWNVQERGFVMKLTYLARL